MLLSPDHVVVVVSKWCCGYSYIIIHVKLHIKTPKTTIRICNSKTLWHWQQHKAIYMCIVQCSRAHNISSDSKLFIWSAFWNQIYPPSVKFTRWHVHYIMRSDIPPMRRLQDDMYIAFWDQIYPPTPTLRSSQDDMYIAF